MTNGEDLATSVPFPAQIVFTLQHVFRSGVASGKGLVVPEHQSDGLGPI